jgi:hypothetical protein
MHTSALVSAERGACSDIAAVSIQNDAVLPDLLSIASVSFTDFHYLIYRLNTTGRL